MSVIVRLSWNPPPGLRLTDRSRRDSLRSPLMFSVASGGATSRGNIGYPAPRFNRQFGAVLGGVVRNALAAVERLRLDGPESTP